MTWKVWLDFNWSWLWINSSGTLGLLTSYINTKMNTKHNILLYNSKRGLLTIYNGAVSLSESKSSNWSKAIAASNLSRRIGRLTQRQANLYFSSIEWTFDPTYIWLLSLLKAHSLLDMDSEIFPRSFRTFTHSYLSSTIFNR